MVPVRNQYSGEPIGGMILPVSGPNPHPRPSTSNSSDHSTTFWKTIGSFHHVAMLPQPSIPVVARANPRPPRM